VIGLSGRCGTVEAVVYESRHDAPDRLLVRSRRWGGLCSVPIADVARVDPDARQVMLRAVELDPDPSRMTVAPWPTAAAALCTAVGIAFIVAGLSFIHGGRRADTIGARSAASPSITAHRPARLPAKPPRPPPTAASLLTVVARRGECWILLRTGDASGQLIDQTLLTLGRRLAVHLDRPIWARIGNPAAIDVYIGGHRVRRLPRLTANITFTAAGMRSSG
jgi:hypothetical protein